MIKTRLPITKSYLFYYLQIIFIKNCSVPICQNLISYFHETYLFIDLFETNIMNVQQEMNYTIDCTNEEVNNAELLCSCLINLHIVDKNDPSNFGAIISSTSSLCGCKSSSKFESSDDISSAKDEQVSTSHPCHRATVFEANLATDAIIQNREQLNPCPISNDKSKATHSRDRIFACDHCYYTTNIKASLAKHMPIHTGELPFACDICDYKAKQKSNLNQHMLKHSGRSKFPCDNCDYKSNRKANLANIC